MVSKERAGLASKQIRYLVEARESPREPLLPELKQSKKPLLLQNGERASDIGTATSTLMNRIFNVLIDKSFPFRVLVDLQRDGLISGAVKTKFTVNNTTYELAYKEDSQLTLYAQNIHDSKLKRLDLSTQTDNNLYTEDFVIKFFSPQIILLHADNLVKQLEADLQTVQELYSSENARERYLILVEHIKDSYPSGAIIGRTIAFNLHLLEYSLASGTLDRVGRRNRESVDLETKIRLAERYLRLINYKYHEEGWFFDKGIVSGDEFEYPSKGKTPAVNKIFNRYAKQLGIPQEKFLTWLWDVYKNHHDLLSWNRNLRKMVLEWRKALVSKDIHEYARFGTYVSQRPNIIGPDFDTMMSDPEVSTNPTFNPAIRYIEQLANVKIGIAPDSVAPHATFSELELSETHTEFMTATLIAEAGRIFPHKYSLRRIKQYKKGEDYSHEQFPKLTPDDQSDLYLAQHKGRNYSVTGDLIAYEFLQRFAVELRAFEEMSDHETIPRPGDIVSVGKDHWLNQYFKVIEYYYIVVIALQAVQTPVEYRSPRETELNSAWEELMLRRESILMNYGVKNISEDEMSVRVADNTTFETSRNTLETPYDKNMTEIIITTEENREMIADIQSIITSFKEKVVSIEYVSFLQSLNDKS